MRSDREVIEIFHLLFLAHLGQRVEKALFALKGGANLRFFFRSIRYSEDMDFDIRTMAPRTLAGNVDSILGSIVLKQGLLVRQIEIEHVTPAKQTETTQRWKVGIRPIGGRVIPTKIEFSRRHGLDPGHELGTVRPDLVRDYGLPPILTEHYTLEAAFRQKIGALSCRAITQARDIFDLKTLIDAGAGKEPPPPGTAREIPKAIENAVSIGFSEFSGQVSAYLAAEFQGYYAKREIWENLQQEVVDALERLR